MAKIIFDPNEIAKSADVNANFAGTWNGTLIDDGAIHKRHLASDATPQVRTYSMTSGSTLPIDSNNYELFVVTALATGITVGNPTGTPVDGQGILVRIKDNGTAQSVAFDTAYEAIGITLPTSTTANKYLYISARYNATASKWDILSVGRQA